MKTARGGYDGRGVWVVRTADEPTALAAELGDRRDPRRRVLRPAAARARRARRPLAVRAGRRLAGRGDRAAGRHLRRGDRARRPGWTTTPPPPPAVSRCASRPSWASSGCWRSSCSRSDPAPRGAGRHRRQRARHAPAQLRALDDGRLGDQPVRAAPARGAGLSARAAPTRSRRSRSWATCWAAQAARPTAPGIGMDERVHHLAARFPDVKVHLYGKAFRPGRKLGHVNVVGSDLGELRRTGPARRRLPGRRDAGRTATTCTAARPARRPADGDARRWQGPEVGPLVGLIMGSDSDWPVMSGAAELLDEFDVDLRGRRRLRAPHPAADAGLRHRGRGPGAPGDHRRGRRRRAPAGHGRLGDGAAGDRRAGAAGHPRRAGLAAVDRADAGRASRSRTVSIGGARNAGLLAVRILASAGDDTGRRLDRRLREHADGLEKMVLDKDSALRERTGH